MKKVLAFIGILLAVAACVPGPSSNPLVVRTAAVRCLSNTSGEVTVVMEPTADAGGEIRFNVQVTLDDGRVIDLPEKSGTVPYTYTEPILLAEAKHLVVESSSHGVHYDLKRFDPAKICGK